MSSNSNDAHELSSIFGSNNWYAIVATLPANESSIEAALIIKKQSAEYRIPLSVTFKGRLFEVVRLHPKEIPIRVVVTVAGQVDETAVIQIQRISYLKAHYWMCHRLASMIKIIPPPLRRRMGFWRVLRQSLYQGYRLLSSFRYHYPAPAYNEWLDRYWQLQPEQKKQIALFKQGQAAQLHCQIVVDVRGATLKEQKNSIDSIQKQVGFSIEPVIWDGTQPLASYLGNEISGSSSYVLYMQAGCRLQPEAIAWFMWQQVHSKSSCCIYSDHDHYTEIGQRENPIFKPTWSMALQRSTGYVGEVVWLSRQRFIALAAQLGDQLSAFSLVLEIGMAHRLAISHIPAALWSKPAGWADIPVTASHIYQLSDYLKRHQIVAKVLHDKHGLARVHYGLPTSLPLVSILIPTRDMLHFLRPCIQSILERTQWPNYEIIIIDNQSSCPETLAYMQALEKTAPRCRVISYDKPFNYSAINNEAARQANGDIICLLNNDTEVISADWLDEMVSQLLQPQVGVVGARLYYTDGRVQHAGDVVGIGGCATHLHGVIEGDAVGYMHRAVAVQDLSAVTAACLVTHKHLYVQLGGLNETQLTIAFNDVDYCLRVRQAGYQVIYSPYAELYHHESVSRGTEDTPSKKARAKAEADYMRSTWQVVRDGDPFYNPNLNRAKADFSLSKVPLVDWPWG